MATSTYVIKPRPPVRAFALSAILALLGAAVIVLSAEYGWPVGVLALGVVVLVLSVALVVLAFVARSRMAVTVEITDDGYVVREPGGVREGRWADVTKVTEAPGRLTFHSGDDRRFHLMAPGGSGDLDRIAAEVARRLDVQRGYGQGLSG